MDDDDDDDDDDNDDDDDDDRYSCDEQGNPIPFCWAMMVGRWVFNGLYKDRDSVL